MSTHELYKLCDLLTVRKLYVLISTLKMHKTTTFDPNTLRKRRNHGGIAMVRVRTAFARRQYVAQATLIYNGLCKNIPIYQKTSYACRETVMTWLKSLTYEETEALLNPVI